VRLVSAGISKNRIAFTSLGRSPVAKSEINGAHVGGTAGACPTKRGSCPRRPAPSWNFSLPTISRSIAAAAFGPAEARRVAADGAPGFYRIWTLKEAMAKASGAGIAEVADRTDRVPDGPPQGIWRANVGVTPWWLALTSRPGLSIAVAIRGEVCSSARPMQTGRGWTRGLRRLGRV
jgi:hypothetical protein